MNNFTDPDDRYFEMMNKILELECRIHILEWKHQGVDVDNLYPKQEKDCSPISPYSISFPSY